MTTLIQNVDSIGSGTRIILSDNDNFVVTAGTVVASNSGIAISGTGDNTITISGEIYGPTSVIDLTGDSNFLTVSSTGIVSSTLDPYSSISAIGVGGNDAVLVNHGMVSGGSALTVKQGLHGSIVNTGTITGNNAFAFDTMDAGSVNSVFNSGYAFGNSFGVRVFASSASASFTITNTGTLIGDGYSIFLTASDDIVYNSGLLIGDVYLGGGADIFDGRGGIFQGTVIGGLGDDTYIIDDTSVLLSEDSFEGTDEVQSEVSWSLGDNFENLTLIGGSAITGIGNTEANTILGNIADNVLRGKNGDDTVRGNFGDDKIGGGNGADTLFGEGGEDVLRGGAANDIVKGGNDDDLVFGGTGDDKLYGDEGNDVLKGGKGFDKLWGGGGDDTFVFSRMAQSTNDSNADVIKDFETGDDRIDFSGLYSGELTYIGETGFTGTAPEVRWSVKNTDIVVRVDIDGNGTADMKIIAEDLSFLTDQDFIL